MSRMYTVEFEDQLAAIADGDIDLFEITPVSNQPCLVHAVFVEQSSETGDAEEEFLRFRVIRGHTTSGSGGVLTTPRPLDPGDAASGFAAETMNDVVASVSTVNNLHSGTFNVRTGLALVLTPEMRWMVTNAQTTLVVRMMAAVTDAIQMSGTLYVEELG